MGIVNSKTKLIGRYGNVVGYRGQDGQYYMRIHQPDIKDPKTPAQLACRDSLSFSSRFISMLDVLGREIQVANGIAWQWRKNLVGRVMGILPDSLPDDGMLNPLPLVEKPVFESPDIHLTMDRKSSTFILHISLTPSHASCLCRCAVALVFYNKTKKEWYSVAARSTTIPSTRLTLPRHWLSDDLHAMAYILPAFTTHPSIPTDTSSATLSDKLDDLKSIVWSQVHCADLTPAIR